MSTIDPIIAPQTYDLPAVPLTLEGSAVLHQMFRFRWTQWRAIRPEDRARITASAQQSLAEMESAGSALFSLLGHKGDVIFVHFRPDFETLNQAQLSLNQLELSEYLEPASSYLSVVELGLYDSTIKNYRDLLSRGVEPHSPEWNDVLDEGIARQREAMRPRLYPQMPEGRYLCFYPMDRKRG